MCFCVDIYFCIIPLGAAASYTRLQNADLTGAEYFLLRRKKFKYITRVHAYGLYSFSWKLLR